MSGLQDLYIGVDVGTGSVRAGLFTSDGQKVSYSTRAITTWRSGGEFSEQSTDDIWGGVCFVIKEVCSSIEDTSLVKGIGFDATCSLAVVSPSGQPVTVSLTKDPQRNVILWQDHQAIAEADYINAKHHAVLQFVGGRISPEMQAPKLLWLKQNLRKECWDKAGHFFDLADYLTYRSTGATSRSLCCLVCKWTFIGREPDQKEMKILSVPPEVGINYGWNSSFWNEIGLSDLVDEQFARIGAKVLPPGQPVAHGLKTDVAEQFGLLPGTPVATAIIDAHAGGLGMIGANFSVAESICNFPVKSRLALIAGTSSCHMAVSDHLVYVPGVWGPYFSAMLPEMYLSEGGQSAAGHLVDYMLQRDENLYQELLERANDSNHSIYEELLQVLVHLAETKSLQNISLLTCDLHILPDYLGNRSPLADPSLRGMICGLTLDNTMDFYAVQYLAVIQSLAYSTKHIIEAMNKNGHELKVILACGGLSHNFLYRQMHADITGLPVVMAVEKESVLLGSAILGAVASGVQIDEAMHRMSRVDVNSMIQPCLEPNVQMFHRKKFAVFSKMYQDQLNYMGIMN